MARVDENDRTVSVVAEPYNLKADQHAYDFTEAANESLSKRWPAKIITNSRWMVLKTKVSDADVPDADGDGRRTIRMIGNERDAENSGKPILTLDVVRVDPETRTFYFKTPDPPYDIGGWNYVRRDLVSESGKRWRATYPGIEYKVKVDGPVKANDFDDADGDGRRVLSLYKFDAGYKVVMPVQVSVTRTATGDYRMKSATPVRVSVKGRRIGR
jgi:hypothetical protein